MALLPGERFLVQQIDGDVVVLRTYTEEEVVRYPAGSANETAKAQKVINDAPELTEEERAFAHFWAGYFWAHQGRELS